ncbi:cytochrome P450 [Acephala macrosclerotiorum]|nr:cytochrome P450 [Acephala macrosclerotiorum]
MFLQLILLTVVVLSVFFRALTRSRKDDREPPVTPSSIPFIGHLLGMITYQGDYFKSLSSLYPTWPIFTLRVFSMNIYVVSSPELAQSLLCNTKSLSFYPFYIAFTDRALGARQEIKDIVAENEGNNRYNANLYHEMYAALALGPPILETNRRVGNSLAAFLNPIGTSEQPRRLFDWVKTAYTVATAESFYGARNPISENPELVKSVWDFEEGLPILFLGIFPSLTARKAWKARRDLALAFTEYYNKGLDRYANSFVKGRAKVARVENFTNSDLGSFEITVLFASLTNTVPNAFTMLCQVLSDPALTSEICEEVTRVATRTTVDGVDHVSLDITAFNTQCPILLSTFQETIRMCVNATPVRVVTEDMMLKDKYLLKKGGIVQVSGGAIHESPKFWGDDSATFNPYRHLKTKERTKEQKKAQSQGLMPFGGGKHLCLGRHLAFVEIVSFVAMLVYGFEVRMKDGSGLVRPPPFRRQPMGENSKKPKHDVEVLVRRKEEFRDVVFGFVVDSNVDAKAVSSL